MKKNYILWSGLFLFILGEYLLFRNYILREIVPFYPRAYDQTVHLFNSYLLYENIIAKGSLLDALKNQVSTATTYLFPIQAAIFYLFFGASRISALTINFIYFALLQLFSFVSFKKITGTYFYSFLFIILSLSVNTVIMANDFRMDFIATCLYGIFCCSVLRSNVFLSKKWTIISIVIAFFLVLIRYIAICYLVGVGVVTLVYYFSILAMRNKQYSLSETKIRVKNLLLFNGIILLVFAYVFCLNYYLIHDYYVTGHLVGGIKILRLKQALLGTGLTPSTQLLYYPKIFFMVHFSETLLLNCSIMFGVFFITYLWIKYYRPSFLHLAAREKKNSYDYKNQLIFLLISIAIPLGILSIDESKSSIVISIIMIPFLYLLVFGFSSIAEKISVLSKTTANYLLIATIIFFSLFLPEHLLQLFSREQGHTWYDGRTHFDDTNTSITKMINDIGDYASFLHWNMTVSADRIGDYIAFPIATFYYETHHIPLGLRWEKLGNHQLERISEQNAVDSLNHSDIFFMNLNNYTPIYPFEISIQPYYALLKEIAEKQMITLGDYYINVTPDMLRLGDYYINAKSSDYYINSMPTMLRVYVRPNLYISGGDNNFITDQGIWLNIPGVVAQQIKAIKLIGTGDFHWLKNRSLKVYAEAEIDKKNVPVKANLTIGGNRYQIMCELPEWQSEKPLVIHLTFSDSYYDGHHQIVISLPDAKMFLKR